jgi:putative SOS response-associated peptidase YedK
VAGLWERWQREDAEAPPFESFTLLTHPNAAIPVPLTPDGAVLISGLAERAWLSGSQLLAGAALLLATTPALTSYPVSHAYRDRARSDYTLIEPLDASDYLLPESNTLDEEDDEQ